jgi:hypothetical protein
LGGALVPWAVPLVPCAVPLVPWAVPVVPPTGVAGVHDGHELPGPLGDLAGQPDPEQADEQQADQQQHAGVLDGSSAGLPAQRSDSSGHVPVTSTSTVPCGRWDDERPRLNFS